jgi:putative transposase
MTKSIIRTISIKLDVDGHEAILQATQKQFNAAASWIACVCWEEVITNTNTAHHRVYGQTRSRFGLGSQLACCARAKALEAIKATKAKKSETCPQFGPRGSVRYDERTYRLMSLDRVSLNTLAGRITCRMILGKRQHTMLTDTEWEIGGADLIWRHGTYYLNVTQSKDAPEQTDTPDTLGIDLGIVQLATDSTGASFTGAKVHEVRDKYQKRRQTLQKVGTRSAKRRLKKMSGREKRFQKDTNQRIATSLVQKAARRNESRHSLWKTSPVSVSVSLFVESTATNGTPGPFISFACLLPTRRPGQVLRSSLLTHAIHPGHVASADIAKKPIVNLKPPYSSNKRSLFKL